MVFKYNLKILLLEPHYFKGMSSQLVPQQGMACTKASHGLPAITNHETKGEEIATEIILYDSFSGFEVVLVK